MWNPTPVHPPPCQLEYCVLAEQPSETPTQSMGPVLYQLSRDCQVYRLCLLTENRLFFFYLFFSFNAHCHLFQENSGHTVVVISIDDKSWYQALYFYSWDLKRKKIRLRFSIVNCYEKQLIYDKKFWTLQCRPLCLTLLSFLAPFIDQTPTPTRFLKNCEEVGLFSDLDCSIEQEFCKAQEEEDSKQVQAGEENRARG